MLELNTEIEINAPAERVWEILTDFPSYPDWNPFVRSIKGTPKKGERLSVTLHPPDGKAMTFTPTVQEATPGKELRWLGRVGVKGIFDGEHSFQIEEIENEKIRFIHKEQFSGIFVPFFRKSLQNGTHRGFVEMNEALKKRAEG